LGLGHAVWCARELVGHEPFALLLPDVLVQHNRGCLAQMIDAGRGLPDSANIIAVEKMPADRLHMYGVVGVGEREGGLFSVTRMVEKPAREKAPSNLIITGRYILQPEIFGVLAAERRGAGGEIQLTDAMIELARMQPFYGLEFEGRAFDCGSKVGFLAAKIAYALAIALLESRGFTAVDFSRLHPGGRLGAMLKFVRDIMHTGSEIPLATVGTRMSEAIAEMTAKTFGCVGITDRRGLLVGIITDGDLRRHMSANLLELKVEQVMTSQPQTVRPDQLVSEALEVLNSTKKTQLIVVDGGRPVGVVHFHDLLRAGVA
jgi:CBS domain-containing protein